MVVLDIYCMEMDINMCEGVNRTIPVVYCGLKNRSSLQRFHKLHLRSSPLITYYLCLIKVE